MTECHEYLILPCLTRFIIFVTLILCRFRVEKQQNSIGVAYHFSLLKYSIGQDQLLFIFKLFKGR